MKAIIVGATGATGADLLQLALKDSAFHRVDVFVRRELDIKNDKLKVHVINFDAPEEWKDSVTGDVLFSCLGTTLKAAGSQEAQRKIDYDYQLEFAKAAKQNNVAAYVLVSSGGASASSPFFYARIKGELENAVKALAFPKLIIFNPPLLERNNSDRNAEIVGAKVIKFFNRLGLFKSNKPLPTFQLAKAMLNAAKSLKNGQHAINARQIWSYAAQT